MISFLNKPKSQNKKELEDKELKLKEKQKKEQIKKEINELQVKWKYLMGQTDSFNKFKKSFGLNDIVRTDYGFSLKIYAPSSLYLEQLEKLKPYIQTEFSCEFIYDIIYGKNSAYADAKIIHPEKVKCNSMPFKPYKVEPYEFYAGLDIAGSPVTFNVNIAPQIMLAGQQRRGKNGALDHAMVSWIHFCSEQDIQFYLFQCAKNDLIKYKDCKQVRCYIEGNMEEMQLVLEHILKEMDRRKELFRDMMSKGDGNDNIFHYNNLHKDNKLPYIYIVIDEFIELMPDNDLDDKPKKLLKNTILRHLQSIAQWGGSYGCNYIICHQKPSVQLCPSFLKNMSSTRICFGFEDESCCQIVLGSGLMKMAHKLPPRKAYYTDNEKNGYLYTTDLKGRIRQNIEKSIKVGHRTVFDDLEKLGLYNPNKNIKKNNQPTNNKSESKLNNSGKEEISYEQKLNQKEKEILEKEKRIKQQAEILENKINTLRKLREAQHKDTYEKVMQIPKEEIDIEKIVEKNKKKIPGWVEYTPPPRTGKEKIK